MTITDEVLQRYVGGQMEIKNRFERYLYRGEIERIALQDNEIRVQFSWFAKGEGFPPVPLNWVKDDTPDYRASLMFYSVSGISEDRLALNCAITHEIAVLFPKGGSRLEPSQVEGLEKMI